MNQLIVSPSDIQALSLIENLLDKMQVKYRELNNNLNDDNLRMDWHSIAADSLSRAYTDDEPEYTSDMLKEPNPEYIA